MAATVSHIATRIDNSPSGPSKSFTGTNFGTEASDRKIAIVSVARGSGVTLSSVTVGGASATIAVDEAGGGDISSQAISIASVPTGTSGTVTMTYSAEPYDISIFVFRVTGVTSNTATDTSTTGTSVDVIRGGLVLALSSNPTTATSTWTILNEHIEYEAGGNDWVSVASGVITDTTFDLAPVCTWTAGSGNLVMASFPAYDQFTNPGNAYSSNDSYATCAATSGDLVVDLSIDGGSTYGTALTKTFTGVEGSQTYGNGSTELWGLSPTRADMVDANFRLRITHGAYSQVYKTFGFTTGTDTLTGIEVSIEAKYASSTISVDHIKVKIYYGTSTLTIQEGSMAFASDGRKAGEGAGSGTGVLVYHDGSAWIATDTGATVAA